jgi:integrase
MSIDDVEDKNSLLMIRIPDSKTHKPRRFIVLGDDGNELNLTLYRKYASLRPPQTPHRRLFLNYKNGKCSTQPVGVHTFGKIPSKIATYLGLENPAEYTGHCLRRSSATLLVDAGADVTTLKRHGGWKSSSVAEGYIEESLENKIQTAKRIMYGKENNNCAFTSVKGVGDEKTGSSTSESDNCAMVVNNENNVFMKNKSALSGINICNVQNTTINININ